MIPESPFYLEGRGGLFNFIEERLKENGHLVIVVAEGAGQEYVAAEVDAANEKDASGNRLLLDVGLWLSQKIKVWYNIFIFGPLILHLPPFSLINIFFPHICLVTYIIKSIEFKGPEIRIGNFFLSCFHNF